MYSERRYNKIASMFPLAGPMTTKLEHPRAPDMSLDVLLGTSLETYLDGVGHGWRHDLAADEQEMAAPGFSFRVFRKAEK